MRHVETARQDPLRSAVGARAVGVRYGPYPTKAISAALVALGFLCARCRGALRWLLRSIALMKKACLPAFAQDGEDPDDKEKQHESYDLTCHETMAEVSIALSKKKEQVEVVCETMPLPNTPWFLVDVCSFGMYQSIDADKWKVFGLCDELSRDKRCKSLSFTVFSYAKEAITNLQHIIAVPDTSRVFKGWQDDYVKDGGRFFPGLKDWFWGDYISADEYPGDLWGWEWDRKSVRRGTMECDVEFIYWTDLSISLVTRAMKSGWVEGKSVQDLELVGMTLGLAAAQLSYKYLFNNRISWNYLMRKGFSRYGSKGYTDQQYKRKLKSEEISLLKCLDWKIHGFCIYDTFSKIIRQNDEMYKRDEDPTTFFMELSKLPPMFSNGNVIAKILQNEDFRIIWFRCVTSSRSIRSSDLFENWQKFVGELIATAYIQDPDTTKLEDTITNALLNFDKLCKHSSLESLRTYEEFSFVEKCLKMKLD